MWKKVLALGSVCAMVACSGAAETTGPNGTSSDITKKACTPTSARAADSLELFISPQDTDQPLADIISAATDSVRVMVYIAGPIKDAIGARSVSW